MQSTDTRDTIIGDAMTYAKLLGLLVLIPLAACGGSGSDKTTGVALIAFDPLPPSPRGTPPESVTELNGDAIRVLNYATSGGLRTERATSRDAGDFAAYIGRFGELFYFEGETDDGAGTATVAAFVNASPLTLLPGATLSRDSGSAPATGTATFQGDYVGFLSRNSSGNDNGLTESIITGDVIIEADFATLTYSGDIVNRERLFSNSGTSAGTMLPVVLIEEQNTNNLSRVSGISSGGGLDQPSAIPSGGQLSGFYSLAFTGESATGVVGTIRIEHDYNQFNSDAIEDDFTETGAIVANR